MAYIFLLVGTMLLIFFLWLLLTSDDELIIQLVVTLIKRNQKRQIQLHEESNFIVDQLESGVITSKSALKKINKQLKKIERMQIQLNAGKLPFKFVPILAGMHALVKFKIDGNNKWYKEYYTILKELEGLEDIHQNIVLFMSTAIWRCLIVGGSTFVATAIATASGDIKQILFVLLIGLTMTFILSYDSYYELKEAANKRRDKISRDFASVASKLALLVSSGMEMSQAWYLTAYSRDELLYQEMQLSYQEIQNNISPQQVYQEFIYRCQTKETSKLGSAILQNLEKGNSEISQQLIMISKEAWEEQKYYVKMKAEKAKSKMLIPIFMMFIGILAMVLAPTMLNLSQGGF